MPRKPKLILITSLLILAGLTLAIFNDSIRAKMFLLYPLRPADPSANGLVGYWPLDGNALDKSGNGNNGTLTGTTVVAGQVNSALSFDGVDDYVDVGTGTLTSGATTLSYWFNYKGSGNGYTFDLKIINANAVLSFSSNGYSYWVIRGTGMTPYLTYSLSGWNHAVFVYNGQGASTLANYQIYI